MEEDNLFFCPLECGARIKSFGKHSKKCKNSKLLGVKYRLCEYNATHIIRNELYETHLLSCNSKKRFEEEKNDSLDDDLKGKFSDSEEEEEKEKEEKKEQTKTENNADKSNLVNKNENEDNNIIKKRRRYRHERALFKDENEIDQESLEFFNKVYV